MTDWTALAEAAVELVPDGSVVGLGTGRAATAFVEALGRRARAGLRVRGVPTSHVTASLAEGLGIPLATLDEVDAIDVAVDGADEVDPRCDLIKGYGGALVREKVVATASRRFVVLVGADKLVPVLGSRGILPVEVIPFALAPCRRRLAALGFPPRPRERDGRLVVTDNGHHIIDCEVPPLPQPAVVEAAIRAIPGVVGTGLFLDVAEIVLIQSADGVEVRRRPLLSSPR